MSTLLAPTDDHLDRAARALRAGKLVGLPTETVYGVAANALDPSAVARLYAAKDRPRFNPLIVHIAAAWADLDTLHARGIIDLDALGSAGRAAAQKLIVRWPGPLTLVLPRGAAVPELTTAGLDTVAVRCPDHPAAQALLRRLDVPLAAPSANRSGRISPTTAQAALDELGDHLELVLDGGPCVVGLESTVVHVHESGQTTLLRPGSLSRQTLESLLGAPVQTANHEHAPRSPGMTDRHYAPDAPFLALPARCADLDPDQIAALKPRLERARVVGVLCWTAEHAAATPRCLPGLQVHALALTHRGDSTEAARRLFGTLRALDTLGADLLLAEPCPPGTEDRGIAHALRDRLRRATRDL